MLAKSLYTLFKTYFMADEKFEPAAKDRTNKGAAVKSDPGTVDTTDPQEHMKGPLSSLMHKIENTAENNNEKDVDNPEKNQLNRDVNQSAGQ